jgi:hypothetical protein
MPSDVFVHSITVFQIFLWVVALRKPLKKHWISIPLCDISLYSFDVLIYTVHSLNAVLPY